MAKLWEHIKVDNMDKVTEYVVDQLLPAISPPNGEADHWLAREGDRRHGIDTDRIEASEQLIRLIWKIMWTRSDGGMYKGSLKKVVVEVTGGDTILHPDELQRLYHQVRASMRSGKLIRREPGRGKRDPSWRVAPYDDSRPISFGRTPHKDIRPDYREEKRIIEETEKNKTVVVTHVDPTIPSPPTDPEGLQKWAIARIDQIVALSKTVQRLEREIDSLNDELEAAKTGEWTAASNAIAAHLTEVSRQTEPEVQT